MKRLSDAATLAARLLFGSVFIVSGFVKAVDPMGSAYKFIDYFRAFDLMELAALAVAMAVLLAAAEFATGACILLGAMRRTSTLFGLLFMVVFTPLTLWLALTNPVKDCGCFGDAIVLTNWQTFYKNILLLVMAVWLFMKRSDIKPLFVRPLRGYVALYAVLFSIAVSQYALSHTPPVDFRPFKKGTNIPEAMRADEGQTTYTLIYSKDGEEREFTLDNYPADDPAWVYVETITHVAPGAKQASITDFFLTDSEGNDMTDDVLLAPGYTFLLISPDWTLADDNHLDRINEVLEFARERGYAFYGVSTADTDKEREWQESTGADYPMLYSDATILETVVRPNPGMVLLREGDIVWKKNCANLPSAEELAASLPADPQQLEIKKIDNKMRILWAALLFFGPILVLLSCEKTILFLIERISIMRKKKMTTEETPHNS
jgi:uncharacterized membrane protein YphA (DoxX/SURF4 family)